MTVSAWTDSAGKLDQSGIHRNKTEAVVMKGWNLMWKVRQVFADEENIII
jgi:hypothetical protein